MTETESVTLTLPEPGRKALEGLSFLLAEDNVTNQLVASQMLKALGGVVEIASDGAIALDILKTRDFDILLIDIEMPRVSGLDVIRAVRGGGGALADKPVIALTAYAMEEHREKIIGVGADGLIAKPITSITALGEDIRRIVGKRIGSNAEAEPKPRESAHDVVAKEARTGTDGPKIERAIFEGLAASIGERGIGMVLRKAKDDLTTAGGQIEMAAETGDIELLRGASHVVISVAGSIGAVRLQRQAEALNRLAHIEELSAAAVLSGEMTKEMKGVLAFLSAESEGVSS